MVKKFFNAQEVNIFSSSKVTTQNTAATKNLKETLCVLRILDVWGKIFLP